MAESKKIRVTKNGPYLVSGNVPLDKNTIIVDKDDNPVEWKEGEKYPAKDNYSLCRCGGSKNKPFCDGAHVKTGFDGTETAAREEYSKQAKTIRGPDLILKDAQELCAVGRFCHRKGGTWNLTERSDDPECKKTAIEEACCCPSGRLVAHDKKTGKPIERPHQKSISLVEDPAKKVSGPIWAKGGIELESSDGAKYESRNRVTLCRCGRSDNKPFCDGSHIEAGFNDGDESIR
jgi:CDGSH-type Zn-finger protein